MGSRKVKYEKNGGDGLHYPVLIGETQYMHNANGNYALYLSGGKWRESASVTNEMLKTESGK